MLGRGLLNAVSPKRQPNIEVAATGHVAHVDAAAVGLDEAVDVVRPALGRRPSGRRPGPRPLAGPDCCRPGDRRGWLAVPANIALLVVRLLLTIW